jgi:hypothetical protein
MGSPSFGVASPGKVSRSGKGAESALDMVECGRLGRVWQDGSLVGLVSAKMEVLTSFFTNTKCHRVLCVSRSGRIDPYLPRPAVDKHIKKFEEGLGLCGAEIYFDFVRLN